MQLYTIGHSTYPTEHFMDLLKQYEVQYIVDVRSTPFSRYAPQYNSPELEAALRKEGIGYAHMGHYFGARQEARRYYSPEGYLDFELFRASEAFIKGMKNVERGLERYSIALMCTEKHPIDCHRAIMVGRGFELDGVDVKHILHDGSCITQAELNRQLLDMYFPERTQFSLFGGDSNTEELLTEAYRLRNRKIGYRPDEEKRGDQEE